MDKNKNICFCILGSIILALVNSNIFEDAIFGLFSGGYGGKFIGEAINSISNIVSFIGIILTTIFSILLIIRNIDLKNK